MDEQNFRENDRKAERSFNPPVKRYSQVHRQILPRLPRNLASFFRREKLCKLEEGFVSRVFEREGISSEGSRIVRRSELYPEYVED